MTDLASAAVSDLVSAGAPVWLIVLLLVLGIGVPAAGSEKAATLPSILGAGARWWQGRRARRRAEAVEEARAAAELTASERVSDKEIARLSAAYDALALDMTQYKERVAAEFTEMRAEVTQLKAALTVANQQFWAAVGYIRVLVDEIRKLAPNHEIPDPPDKLKDIL
ncbi:hypothetical protein WKY82_20410 [Gordonia malaquae]|uniref:hypothetical protein n=1 Tax=Gordonia malaquae TaxID=410332 RepID=UPI0030C79A9B